MRAFILAALLGTGISPAFAHVNIVDGDTLKIDGVKIRIVDIDTPETFRSRCENELLLGLKAKERLRVLIDQGEIMVHPDGRDRFGRILAKVFVRNRQGQVVDIGQTLMGEGHALTYRPGREAKLERLRAWCGPDAVLP